MSNVLAVVNYSFQIKYIRCTIADSDMVKHCRFGVLFNMARLVMDDFRGGFENGPWWQRLFNGYSITTWLVVLNLGSTGLLVSWLMKYADNIIKVKIFFDHATIRPDMCNSESLLVLLVIITYLLPSGVLNIYGNAFNNGFIRLPFPLQAHIAGKGYMCL